MSQFDIEKLPQGKKVLCMIGALTNGLSKEFLGVKQ